MTHTFDFEVSLHYWLLWPTVYHTVYTLCNEITANLGEGCDIGLGKWTIFFVFLREKFSFCPKNPTCFGLPLSKHILCTFYKIK